MRSDVKNPNLIVKNGALLFLRLLLVMAMAFYTTRLALQVLGDEDYGINNVVGGLISVFAIVSMPITSTLQRFFNVEFTRQDIHPRVVFCSSLRIIIVLSLVMIFLFETIGLFFVNRVLNYPEGRTLAVNVIYQLTIIGTIINLFSLVYSSLLFAKENMGVPATVEIVGTLLKLLLLFTIPLVPADALIIYSALILFTSVLQLTIYYCYCRRKYSEAKWTSEKDSRLQKEILRFAGWSSLGSVAGISLTYISNIIINVFGGVLYNTAYGIASQLSNAVVSFATNVMKAVEPQITSSTVSNQNSYRDQLTMSSIKISFLGIGFCYIVFFFYGQELLKLWLGHVPAYVNDFCRVSLLNILFTSIVLPLRTIVMAIGEIKKIFINYGILALTANVVMFILLKIGWPVITVMYIILLVNLCYFISVLFIVDRITTLKTKSTLLVVVRCVVVLLVTGFIFYFLCQLFKNSFVSMSLITILCFLILLGGSYIIVTTESEKVFIKEIKQKFIK